MIVAVTGATGFLAGHVIADLLNHPDQVKQVRGTVRDISNMKRLEWLRKLPGAEERLQLFEADLTKRGSFDNCLQSADAVIHVAAVTELEFTSDPVVEIVAPGVAGAKEIAEAAQRQGVKRIILTSSGSVVDQFDCDRMPDRRGKLIIEDEQRADLRPQRCPYVLEKFLAESVMRETFKNGPVISLLPTLIIGPQQNTEVRSSQILMKMLAAGEIPLAPRFYACYVDVRECATAHRLSLFVDLKHHNNFRRYIISSSDVIGAEDIAKSMNSQFKAAMPKAAPTWPTPHWLMWVASWFDGRLTDYVRFDLALPRSGMDPSRAAAELGWKPQRKLDAIVKDTMQSFFELGIVQKLKK